MDETPCNESSSRTSVDIPHELKPRNLRAVTSQKRVGNLTSQHAIGSLIQLSLSGTSSIGRVILTILVTKSKSLVTKK